MALNSTQQDLGGLIMLGKSCDYFINSISLFLALRILYVQTNWAINMIYSSNIESGAYFFDFFLLTSLRKVLTIVWEDVGRDRVLFFGDVWHYPLISQNRKSFYINNTKSNVS